MSVQDDLVKQILAQNKTSMWSGGYGADNSAKDMARILESIGITDIKQFGKVPAYEPITITDWKYNGRRAAGENTGLREAGTDQFGDTIFEPFELPKGEKATPVYSRSNWAQGDDGGGYSYYTPLSAEEVGQVINKNGNLVRQYSENYGNKLTGQYVPVTYSERQTGNAWGGTFEGSGNTGYRVDFTPDGTPVFYTTGASSSDVGDFLPFLAIAGLGLGLPMLGEAFGGGLSALDAGMGVYGSGLGAATGGAGMLESVFDPTFGGELAPVIGGGAESVFDPTLGESALDAGMNAYPNTGNIGAPKPITPSDIKRALDVASKVTGGDQPTGSTKPVYDAAGKLISGGAAGATGTAGTTAGLGGVTQGQPSVDALLNLMGSNNQLANIKSVENLFGSGIFASPEKSEPKNEGQTESSEADKRADEVNYFGGGHVNNIDVDALLQILRS